MEEEQLFKESDFIFFQNTYLPYIAKLFLQQKQMIVYVHDIYITSMLPFFNMSQFMKRPCILSLLIPNPGSVLNTTIASGMLNSRP